MDINNLKDFVTTVSVWRLQSTQVPHCPVDSRLNSQTVSPTHVQLAFSEEPSFSQAPLNCQAVSNGLCSSSTQGSQVLCVPGAHTGSLGFGSKSSCCSLCWCIATCNNNNMALFTGRVHCLKIWINHITGLEIV